MGQGPGAGGLAIKAMASELKLPVVSGGAVDALGVPADPYFFKIAPANRDFMKVYLTWCKERGYKKLAFVLGNDAYGQGEAQAAKEITASLGLDIAALETFSATDSNFSSQLVRVRSAAPDIVYSAGTGAPGILIYKQYRQLGLKYPLCFMLAALTSAFFQAIGGASEADGVMTPGLLGMLGKQARESPANFTIGLLKRSGDRPAWPIRSGWDIGIVTEAAIKKSDASRESIRAALDQVKDLPGINGPITFTPQNRHRPGHARPCHAEARERQVRTGRPNLMLDSAALAQFLLTGLTTGCAYALVALAIVLMFNVSGVVNLAQGEYGALGGLLLASMSAMHMPLPLSLALVIVAGLSLGTAQERLTIRPIRSAPQFVRFRCARRRCRDPRRGVPDLGQGSAQRPRLQR